MKRVIIIIVIALLCVWSVIATVSAADIESQRRKLSAEHSFLESNYEDKEEAYDKLKAEHSDLRSAYLKGLAYEWLYDMRCHFTEDGYDAEFALDAICQREGLNSAEKSSIRTYVYGIAQYE